MKATLSLILIACLAWLVVSPFVWGYHYFKASNTERDNGWGCLFGLGAFIACTYVLQEGLYAGLAFLPDRWGGYDEDGEFVTMRRSLSGIGGFACTLFLVDLLDKAKRNRPNS